MKYAIEDHPNHYCVRQRDTFFIWCRFALDNILALQALEFDHLKRLQARLDFTTFNITVM